MGYSVSERTLRPKAPTYLEHTSKMATERKRQIDRLRNATTEEDLLKQQAEFLAGEVYLNFREMPHFQRSALK